MCGIAGCVRLTSERDDLNKVLERLRHRGPDDSGIWSDRRDCWHAHLGHRRLSIIDIQGGHQPLSNSSETVFTVFNGEIFNFLDLRRDLERQGCVFRTRSDTEVIPYLYEKYGETCFKKLNGMFALAIWDRSLGRLILARDHAGIKPLYYSHLQDGSLNFASELSALLRFQGVSKRLSRSGLLSYLSFDYAHPPHTLVEGALKLPPGHYLVWENGRLHPPRPFWSVKEVSCSDVNGDEAAYTRQLCDHLESAVESQLIADVPVGVFLSGGIDSSTVAAIARKKYPHTLQTFSIGFSDPQFDESVFAREVAQHIQSEHHEHIVSESELLSRVDEIWTSLDEPLADPSYLPTYLLSELASRHVKVVLGGDGGDEVWAGYPTYRAHAYARTYGKLPHWFKYSAFPWFARRYPLGDSYQPLGWKLKRFVSRWQDDPGLRHLYWMASLSPRELPNANGRPLTIEPWDVQRGSGDDFLNSILTMDFQTYMPGSVLTKVDRASMAHSLEVRPPLLDRELVEWAFNIPSAFKLRNGETKYLLKQAVRAYLPDSIIHRKKRGFAIPLRKWLKGPLRGKVDALLNDSPLWESEHLPREHALGLFNEDRRGSFDYSKTFWAYLILDHWVKKEGIDVHT